MNKRNEQIHVSLNVQKRAGFQERGGPRSVSGEPTEEMMIAESSGREMWPPVFGTGTEVSTACKVTN